jgi:hypothetical protein
MTRLSLRVLLQGGRRTGRARVRAALVQWPGADGRGALAAARRRWKTNGG